MSTIAHQENRPLFQGRYFSPIKRYMVFFASTMMLISLVGTGIVYWQTHNNKALWQKITTYHQTTVHHLLEVNVALSQIETFLAADALAVPDTEETKLAPPVLDIPMSSRTNIIGRHIEAIVRLQETFEYPATRSAADGLVEQHARVSKSLKQLSRTPNNPGIRNDLAANLATFSNSLRQSLDLHTAGTEHSLDALEAEERENDLHLTLVAAAVIAFGLFATLQGFQYVDVADRREKTALRTSARLGRILEDSWNEIYLFDAETYKFTKVNHGALANMGFPITEMESRTAYDIKPEFTRETFIEAVQPLRDGTEKFLIFETVHQRKDGSRYPVEVRLQLLADETPPIFFAVINDITKRKNAERKVRALNASLELRVAQRTAELNEEIQDRKQAQEALEASEARMRAILDTAADGIITIDNQGTILRFNKAAETIFQRPTANVVGQNVSILMPEKHAHQHDGYLEEYLETGQTHIIGQRRELEGLRQDGSRFPMELSVSEVQTGSEPVFTGIVRDISQRKAVEEKLLKMFDELKQTQDTLVETEKMASLGNLVAGVAHEINTPVGVSLTASSHLRDRTVEFVELYSTGQMKRVDLERFVSTADESCRIMESNLHRASDLIRSFKQVAVDQTEDAYRKFKLNDYVEEILKSLQPKLKNRPIEIEIDIDPELRMNSNPGALSQVITNLVVNSLIHGFEKDEKGRIQIQATLRENDVSILFEDNGRGMDAATTERIFEPFFTTKRGSGGSGLGMHIVYNLVTQSLGGTVACESEPENGVRFNIEIPQEIVRH